MHWEVQDKEGGINFILSQSMMSFMSLTNVPYKRGGLIALIVFYYYPLPPFCMHSKPTGHGLRLFRACSEKNAPRETSAKKNNEVSHDSVRLGGCSVNWVSRECGRIRPRSPPPKVVESTNT
jgi:hypothetical protein